MLQKLSREEQRELIRVIRDRRQKEAKRPEPSWLAAFWKRLRS